MHKMLSTLCLLFCFVSGTTWAAPADLSPDEKQTISVFKNAARNVVFVHRIQRFDTAFPEQVEVAAGSGSGIIWDDKGHIVTNYHVIHGSDKLMVSSGDKTVPAKLVGAEPRKDIAVLKLLDPNALYETRHFTPFKMTSKDNLVVGQKTIAIGNPFGLDHSLTTGVISALGREVPGVGGVTIKDMVQTDASINPGNSGGPLLDGHGRLIGLNTMIYSRSGTSSGVGFAVPAETVARIVPQLIQYGRVKMSGIGIVPLGQHIARYFQDDNGVFVAKVLPNSPAAKSGLIGAQMDGYGRLMLGDRIIGINKQPVKNYNDLYNILSRIPIGDKIDVAIQRFDKTKVFSMRTIDISEEL